MSYRDGDEGMTLARFAAIVDAYGAAARRWPDAERAAAEALLAVSTEARAICDAAARLDTALGASAAPAPSAELRAALLRAAPGGQAAKPVRGGWRTLLGVLAGELGGLRPAGAVFGLALILGAMAGGVIGSRTDVAADPAGAQDVDVMQLALFDDQIAEY